MPEAPARQAKAAKSPFSFQRKNSLSFLCCLLLKKTRTRAPRAPRVTLARGRRRRPQGSEEFASHRTIRFKLLTEHDYDYVSCLSYGMRFGGGVAQGSGGA